MHETDNAGKKFEEKTGSISTFFDVAVEEGLFPCRKKLKYHIFNLFKNIDFNGKTVLDIGGGAGLYSFYASFKGAKRVVCLEPEFDGSSSGVIDRFQKINNRLNRNNVEFRPITIQEFAAEPQTFDIILLYNSINHLNETACIKLLDDAGSQQIYKDIFTNLYLLSRNNADLIICDCSRYNFFAALNIKNPIDPSIEWQKHQAPEVWSRLLSEVGFINPQVRWSSINSLRTPGNFLLGNRFCAYFFTSHFRLTMKKP